VLKVWEYRKNQCCQLKMPEPITCINEIQCKNRRAQLCNQSIDEEAVVVVSLQGGAIKLLLVFNDSEGLRMDCTQTLQQGH